MNVDLYFQGYDVERAALPGQYAGPRCALVAAIADQTLAGCCALRSLDNVDYSNACEMKRLFVRPQFRATGIGWMLTEANLDAARQAA